LNIAEWVKEHPYTTGAIVLVGGLGIIFLLGNRGGSASGSGDAATSAYFQAEAAQGIAGDQLQATQIAAQASTAQALIAANANENINSTWATADVTQTENTNAAQVSLAPYAAEAGLAQALVGVANAPPLTTTSSGQSHSSGFFGIGAHTSNYNTVTETANPAAVSAEQYLTNLLNGFSTSNTGHIAGNG